jgi:hypothetical protein
LVATALASVALPLAATSASALLDPNVGPAAPHVITVFPARDFVNLGGYTSSAPLTVKVLRGGFVVGTTLPFAPVADPKNPGQFMADINHAGPPCWEGVTPDIRAGDVVQVLTSPTTGDQTPTADVTVTSAATLASAGTVVIKGTARAPGGGRIPIDQLESRIVAGNLLFAKSGKRTLRADATGTADGTLAYDGPTATTWTATFPSLVAGDVAMAVGGESRGMWLGRNPAVLTENTIYEYGPFPGTLVFPGPAVGCFAPFAKGPSIQMTAATDTGASTSDGITKNLSPTFAGATGLLTATNVNLYVDGVLRGTQAVGAGNSYSLTPTTPLTPGKHTVTAGEIDPTTAAETMTNAPLAVTIDTTAPAVTTRGPAVNATGVSQAANSSATFSEPVTGVNGTTLNLKKGTVAVAAAVTYNATTRVATLNPTAALVAGTKYTTSLTSAVKDVAGNLLTATSWSYTTGPRPTVTTKTPAANAVGVSRLTNITATFSENVKGTSATTFTLVRPSTGARVAGTVSYNATTRVVTLNPGVTLLAGTRYSATLTTGIKDADANSITALTWSFTAGR